MPKSTRLLDRASPTASGMGTVRKPGLALGRAERGNARSNRDELAVDSDLPAQEVDAIDGEPEAFPLPHPHSGREAGSARDSERAWRR